MAVLILKLCIKGGGRLEGLPAEAGAGLLKLILIRERSLATPRSGTDITTFGEGEKFRIASKLSSKFDVGCGSGPSHVLRPFLLALHTNLAADVAKLGMSRAHIGGTLELLQAVRTYAL